MARRKRSEEATAEDQKLRALPTVLVELRHDASFLAAAERPTEAQISRAVEIDGLARTATEALVKLADLASGDNSVGSLGRLGDVLQTIRDLPAVRQANGVVKGLVFALPRVGEEIPDAPGA